MDSFDGTNGKYPYGRLILSGSTLYGMASQGGAYGWGTIFSEPVAGGAPTVLASFNGTNGRFGTGSLVLSGSTLYGMTRGGGVYGDGNIFSINTNGSGFQNLLSFSGGNGASPQGSLTLSGSTLYGMTYGGGANNFGTVFALRDPNIIPPAITLGGAANATIITGGTAAAGITVSNAPSSTYNLNFTLGATVLSGSATLGTITSGSGSLAPGGSQSCTVSATSTNLGSNTLSFTAGDPNAVNNPQTTTAVLTVYDHSNASLSPATTQTSQTINFGNVLRGATAPSQTFTIYNLAANTSPGYTANLKLTGFTPSGNTAFQTNLATFGGLPAASGSNGNTFTAALNTSSYMTGSGTITIAASQLADDSSLPGAGNNNNGGLTVALQGNVGNATADASSSPASFGTALTAPVAANASYANLESTVTATTGSGGQSMVGSTATILAGTASVATTASMAWRTATLPAGTASVATAARTAFRPAASKPPTGAREGFVSDVLSLTGIAVVDGQTKDGSVHTDTFVLQMNYSPPILTARTGLSELAAAQAGLIQMDYLDLGPDDVAGTLDDQWEPAVLGNFGSDNDTFLGLGAWNGDMTLGDWGVNVQTHTVWAVLDHNSQFAVVPEPTTLALLAAAAIGLVGYEWRRRHAAGRWAE